MATFNINWDACGSSSDNQYIYYGKTNVATGTPISGTGWTLYTGAPLQNSTSSALITGLDDNVEYTFYGYCHCAAAGNGPLTTQGPIIKYVCPTLSNVLPAYNGLSYNLTVPSSANNSGSWIQTIVVSVYDSSNLNLIDSNTYTQPFSNVSGSFTTLNAGTNYNLQVKYSNNGSTRNNVCSSIPFTTAPACTAPTVTVNNATSNTFDVIWTPSTGGTFDILVNNSVVASGLTTSPYTVTNLNPATIYQVNVRKNCATGGTAISTTQNITTTNALVNGIVSMNRTGTSGQAPTTLIFSFPSATTFPMTLYFGYTWQNSCGSCPGGTCKWSNGYDIFTPPLGSQNCPSPAAGDTYSGPPHLPFVVNIPQGVTNYTATNIFTTAGPTNPPLVTGPWLTLDMTDPNDKYTDLYVKVNSPSGYSANFNIADGNNITGVTIHNV